MEKGKKRTRFPTWKFDFTIISTQVELFSFVSGRITPKRLFEIKWPLEGRAANLLKWRQFPKLESTVLYILTREKIALLYKYWITLQLITYRGVTGYQKQGGQLECGVMWPPARRAFYSAKNLVGNGPP